MELAFKIYLRPLLFTISKVDGAGVNASNNITVDGNLVLGNGDISTSGY